MPLRRLRLRVNDESQDGEGRNTISAPIFCEAGRSATTVSWDGVSIIHFHCLALVRFQFRFRLPAQRDRNRTIHLS